ncbi:MAG TPA: serine hydrolase domain-containing protein [Burkholderiaceae bacterium]|nr:serine hydrolase domain-containing protein [Burkholderiaceae bacterium]
MTDLHVAAVDECGTPAADASTAIVPWWSFTKTLVAVAALRLVEQGRLALDAPLPAAPFTLRQLLQHRAGLGDYGALPAYRAAVERADEPWSDDVLFRHVPPSRLLFAPGEGWAYSNVGYLLARRTIEAACGAGLDRVLEEQVLGPLGLAGSRFARGPDDMRATAFEGGRGYHPGWVRHGLVVGPAVEAALALHRILNGGLLSPASRAALLAAHPVGGPPPGRPWTSAGYGLGLMIGTMRGPGADAPLDVVGHSAGGPGSVGAVYHAPRARPRLTVAAFAAGPDGGLVEDAALRRLAGA